MTAALQDGTALGSAIVRPDGTFHIYLKDSLRNGEAVTVRSETEDGSTSSVCRITTPDYLPPQPVRKVEVSPDGLVIRGDGAEPNATVRVFSEGKVLGVSTAGPDGVFEVSLRQPRMDGGMLKVHAFDAAGNASEAVELRSPDAAPPQVTMKVAGNGTSVSGTVVDGDSIAVWQEAPDGTRIPVPVEFENDGHFFGWLPEPLQNGEPLVAVSADAVGNRSEITVYAPDLKSPEFTAPPSYNAVTNLIRGGGEVGTAVSVFNGSMELCGTGVVGSDGMFEVRFSCRPEAGDKLKVVLSDDAFNCSTKYLVLAAQLEPLPAPVMYETVNVNSLPEPGAARTASPTEGQVAQADAAADAGKQPVLDASAPGGAPDVAGEPAAAATAQASADVASVRTVKSVGDEEAGTNAAQHGPEALQSSSTEHETQEQVKAPVEREASASAVISNTGAAAALGNLAGEGETRWDVHPRGDDAGAPQLVDSIQLSSREVDASIGLAAAADEPAREKRSMLQNMWTGLFAEPSSQSQEDDHVNESEVKLNYFLSQVVDHMEPIPESSGGHEAEAVRSPLFLHTFDEPSDSALAEAYVMII